MFPLTHFQVFKLCVSFPTDLALTVGNIRQQKNHLKIWFVEYNVSRSLDEIFSEIRLEYSSRDEPSHYIIQKILYPVDENKRPLDLREWIMCEKEKIYCAYCISLSASYPDNQKSLIEGLKTSLPLSFITKSLKSHESCNLHKINKHKYLKATREHSDAILHSENSKHPRAVVQIILKIIIFLASHGENN